MRVAKSSCRRVDMRSDLLRKSLLALAVLLGVSLAASSTQAQYPYGRDRYGYDVYQIAQEQGYRDGVDHGADHARQGKRYDPQGTSHYKEATSGYRSEYGNKNAYKEAYREGFRRGYDDGYRRYGGRYGRRNSDSRAADILGSIFGHP